MFNLHNDAILSSNLTINDVLLVPSKGTVKSREDIKLSPFLMSAPMDTVTGFSMAKALAASDYALPVVSRFISDEELAACFAANLFADVFYAIGSKPGDLEKFCALLAANTDPSQVVLNLAVDVAHGCTDYMLDYYRHIRSELPVNRLMSGSIATGYQAGLVIEAGCDTLRVGIGPGGSCQTRIKCGVGVPQLTAVYDVFKTADSYRSKGTEVYVVADGGIKHPGDVVKYLAAGADVCMLGQVFAKAEESPGWENSPQGLVKYYRGQASREFQQDTYSIKAKYVEGVQMDKPIRATDAVPVTEIVSDFEAGLRSALSYMGMDSLSQLNPENAHFIKITPSGYTEGTPHGNS